MAREKIARPSVSVGVGSPLWARRKGTRLTLRLSMSGTHRLRMVILAGLLAGMLILGLGGRLVMRILAYTTLTPPRFTAAGSLQVLAAGTAWGGVTAPLWLLLERLRSPRLRGLAFGALVLGLAAIGFAVLAAVSGPLVAPLVFRLLGAFLFVLLFLGHGWLVDWLATRWARGQPGPRR